ncbi:hypothetical protein K9M74_05615 [Candidatus Woesearchaeota archaeon]|nr:hypothetical protein [Candidatus Woesearchaeota archaeon]
MTNNKTNDLLVVETINEMKNSQVKGLTYQLTSYVKDAFRTKEGLNIFTITDGEEDFKLVKFVPGAIAFPDIIQDVYATFQFTRSHYEGTLQGKIVDAWKAKADEEVKAKELVQDQLLAQFQPKGKPQLKSENFVKMHDMLNKGASVIRQAILEKRPIIITHHGDADGYAAGLQLERAIRPMIDDAHPFLKYPSNYFMRNPSRTPWYDVIDATKDIGTFLMNAKRNDLSAPLILIVDNGSTAQDLLAMRKAKIFGADVMVIDHHDPGVKDKHGQTLICKETINHVNPHLVGISDNMSASMVCYELAHLVNENVKSDAFVAAVGGVADRCEGAEIDELITLSGESKEYVREVALTVDYEIFQTKMNLQLSPINTLLYGPKKERDALVLLYRPIILEAQEELNLVVQKYVQREQQGKYTLFSLDGEVTALRGDYFSVGKLAAIVGNNFEEVKPRIIMVHTDGIIVFRAEQEQTLFDVNKLVPLLIEAFPYARISGGGHAVAGSIKYLPAAKEEVLTKVKDYIASL